MVLDFSYYCIYNILFKSVVPHTALDNQLYMDMYITEMLLICLLWVICPKSLQTIRTVKILTEKISFGYMVVSLVRKAQD